MPKANLKPCPFCGSTDLHIDADTHGARIVCYDCLSIYWQAEINNEDDLISCWNKRPEDWKLASEAIETAAEEKPDIINHPPHYETAGIECIDAMVITQGRVSVMDFCVCNAFKYLWRFRNKGGLEDIKKARWYLDKYIKLWEGDDGES